MKEGRSVLEIGYGIGLDSFTIAKRDLHLAAMDLTPIGVKTTQNRFANQSVEGEFLLKTMKKYAQLLDVSQKKR
jgi:cyclopropane fatty-acyl-phospholipid synthase-like methyltransferase